MVAIFLPKPKKLAVPGIPSRDTLISMEGVYVARSTGMCGATKPSLDARCCIPTNYGPGKEHAAIA